MEKPKCWNCGKPLRLKTYPVVVPKQVAVAKNEHVNTYSFDYGHLKGRVTSVRENLHPKDTVSIYIHTGTYGEYGDNRWCGQRCAHAWAVANTIDPLAQNKETDNG